MPDNKFYIFAGARKVAEGCGKALAADSAMSDALDALKVAADGTAHSVQDLQATLDEIKLREKMAIPEIPFPKEMPELSFRVKISKRSMRCMRRQLIGSKPRLPRKLKKAAKHADFDVFDLLSKTDAQQDSENVNATVEYNLRVRTNPAGYPCTKWVRRLTNIVHRIMLRQHRRFMYRLLKQQYLSNLLNLNEK